jgi:hypothetical protein
MTHTVRYVDAFDAKVYVYPLTKDETRKVVASKIGSGMRDVTVILRNVTVDGHRVEVSGRWFLEHA